MLSNGKNNFEFDKEVHKFGFAFYRSNCNSHYNYIFLFKIDC